MKTQLGPGGPHTDHDEGFARLATFSPDAARNVLVDLTARLRDQDLAVASGWSHDVGGELLD